MKYYLLGKHMFHDDDDVIFYFDDENGKFYSIEDKDWIGTYMISIHAWKWDLMLEEDVMVEMI